jgi:hypothetical protein
LTPGGARCIITIEERIPIGTAHYFRIPFPTDLFDRTPETRLRVSVTLAYRAPVRKTNARYRGTILEWGFSKIGESFDQFRRRCSIVNPAAAAEEDDELEDEPIGNWNWTVKQRLLGLTSLLTPLGAFAQVAPADQGTINGSAPE